VFPRARKRALVAASVVGTVTFAIGVLLPAVNAQAAAGCSVTYLANSWPGGMTANITIRNVGDPITSWVLGFAFRDTGQRVGQGWSATWAQSGVNVTATNMSYNGTLATGASTSIGFNGTWTSANPDPQSFTLNGTVCTGTVNPSSPPPSSRPPSSPPPSSAPPSSPPPVGQTPVAINGQLRVCGVNLCNRFNRPIQLRGMSTHGLQWFANCYTDASLNALATDWRSDLLRISMYVQEMGYETNPTAFTNQVNQLVEAATARGLYAIIDFHILTPGDPMFNLERARTFFTAVSQRHAAKNNIIYEIANEPNGVSWATIKSYAEQIIPVIRGNDPDAPVIVGTRGWSSLGVSDGSNANEIINNPVNAQNIMYAFHFYAASHRDNYRAEVDRAAALIPLFVSEFGTVTFTGGGTFDAASSTAWLDLLDRRKISYANWTFSDADESSAAYRAGTCGSGGFLNTASLTESGNFMRNRIRTPDNFPTS
jgi:endoglucanase